MVRYSDPRFWIPVTCSFFLTLGGILVASASAGSGHGNFLPVIVLFPFALLLSGALGLGSWYLVTLAVIQFPIYGVLLGQGGVKGHFIATALLLFFIHGGAVAMVLMFADRGAWAIPAL